MSSNKLKEVRKGLGIVGLYILQCLELRTVATKGLKFRVSDDILKKVAKEIDLPNMGLYGTLNKNYEPYKYIRMAISVATKSGYVIFTKEKDKAYIQFPHLKKADKTAVLKGVKGAREVNPKNSRPSDKTEVAMYMVEYSAGKMDIDTAMLEGEKFYDYWEEKGWSRKSGAIKDWKATVRRWLNSDYRKQTSTTESNAIEL